MSYNPNPTNPTEQTIVVSIKSHLIGQKVTYSMTKGDESVGIIVDGVLMKNSINDNCAVSGYLIENEETGQIHPVQYWRILKKVNYEKVPLTVVKGGFDRETLSEAL